MENEKIKKLLNEVKMLSAAELALFIRGLEEYGVKTLVSVPASLKQDSSSEEKQDYDVVLKATGDRKLDVIKSVREIMGLGLKEAKEIIERPPQTIVRGVSRDEAERIADELRIAGADVSLR